MSFPSQNTIPPQVPLNQPQEETKSKFANKKILIGLVLAILIMSIAIVFVLNRPSEDEDLGRQNERLVQINPDVDKQDFSELNSKREKVLDYAASKGISASDEEISNRKAEIIKQNGQEAVNNDLRIKGWNDEDWTEVLRWQLLREKILMQLQAYRIGEILMIRWDSTIQNINESIASERRPAAEQYLESVKTDLESGNISNLKEAQSSLDTTTNSFFTNSPYHYEVQYSGIGSFNSITSSDPNINGFYQFDINENVANAQELSNLNIPSISDVVCNLRSCHIYNIVGGSDGATNANEQEILDILQSELLI